MKRDRLSIESSALYDWGAHGVSDDEEDDHSTASSALGDSKISKKLKLSGEGASKRISQESKSQKPTPQAHHLNPYDNEPILNQLSLRDRNVAMHDTTHGHHNHSHSGLHPSPFVEDIDLLDEMIVLRNPSTKVRNLSAWKLSDDEGKNTFTIPKGISIPQGGILHIYCCSKGRDFNLAKNPHVLWTNKDGKPRMKNVLNDDGDTISLIDPDGVVVSTCTKIAATGHMTRLGPAHPPLEGSLQKPEKISSTFKSKSSSSLHQTVGNSISVSSRPSAYERGNSRSQNDANTRRFGTSMEMTSSVSTNIKFSQAKPVSSTRRSLGFSPFSNSSAYALSSKDNVIESRFIKKVRSPSITPTVASPISDHSLRNKNDDSGHEQDMKRSNFEAKTNKLIPFLILLFLGVVLMYFFVVDTIRQMAPVHRLTLFLL